MIAKPKKAKQDKIDSVLRGLVEYYLKTGKAVGSEALRLAGFEELSSATIRNYFVELEETGFLMQHHTSGGRVPTAVAFRHYATLCQDELAQEALTTTTIDELESDDIKEVALYLQRATENLAEQTACAAFMSAPRFDQDFVTDIKLVSIDHSRAVAILLTSFGQMYTELLHSPHKISTLSVKRIEEYFQARLKGSDSIDAELTQDERELALRFYQETMTRYIVSYVNFTKEDVFRTGFSKLLRYPEFQEAESLTASLSLFENQTALRALVRDVIKAEKTKVWIAEDLFCFLTSPANCTVIVAPYSIGHKKVGAIGVIGPMRMPYKHILEAVGRTAATISQFLEKNLYRHKITFRTPANVGYEIGLDSRKLLMSPEEQHLLPPYKGTL